MVKKASNGKSSKKTAAARSGDPSPAIQVSSQPDEQSVRERAHSIWIEEGRPHGRDLVHWQRAHQELQREAR